MTISPEIDELVEEIKQDRTHGASELARQAMTALKTAAERSRTGSAEELLMEQQKVGRGLKSARPSMAPVFNIVNRLLDIMANKAEVLDIDSLRQLIISEADKLGGIS